MILGDLAELEHLLLVEVLQHLPGPVHAQGSQEVVAADQEAEEDEIHLDAVLADSSRGSAFILLQTKNLFFFHFHAYIDSLCGNLPT